MVQENGRPAKRRRVSESGDIEEERDRPSELPKDVVLHIIGFLNIKDAVRTCILSKQWTDLWKSLQNLRFHSSDFKTFFRFTKFATGILSKRAIVTDDSARDGPPRLRNLHFEREGLVENHVVRKVINLAVSQCVEELTILVDFGRYIDKPPRRLCRSESLTYLNFALRSPRDGDLSFLPKSLILPTLSTLRLENVVFVAGDGGHGEPFSPCKKLNTLYITNWGLHDTRKLKISDASLDKLTIICKHCDRKYKIELCNPNLRGFSFLGDPALQLSDSNVPLLESVYMSCFWKAKVQSASNVLNWLQMVTNAKTLALHSSIFLCPVRES